MLATPLAFVAFELVGLSFMFPNPTSIGGDEYLARASAPPEPVGIQRITRHPFLWGMSLWAGAHLLANGSVRDLVLFGALFVTAMAGTFAIDGKRRRALGDRWSAYAAVTSNAPLLAIATGRTNLSLREIGWWRPLVPALVFGIFYAAHGVLFGAPLPPS
jgi:uncharacterized membrane protein